MCRTLCDAHFARLHRIHCKSCRVQLRQHCSCVSATVALSFTAPAIRLFWPDHIPAGGSQSPGGARGKLSDQTSVSASRGEAIIAGQPRCCNSVPAVEALTKRTEQRSSCSAGTTYWWFLHTSVANLFYIVALNESRTTRCRSQWPPVSHQRCGLGTHTRLPGSTQQLTPAWETGVCRSRSSTCGKLSRR